MHPGAVPGFEGASLLDPSFRIVRWAGPKRRSQGQRELSIGWSRTRASAPQRALRISTGSLFCSKFHAGFLDCGKPFKFGHAPPFFAGIRRHSPTITAGQKPFWRFTQEKRRNRNFRFFTLNLISSQGSHGRAGERLPSPARFLPTRGGNSSPPAIRVRKRVMRGAISPIMPATGHPYTAASAHRPMTRRPGVTRGHIGRRNRHDRRNRHGWRGHHDRGRRGHCHDRDRQWNSERETETNSGIGRQARRANQGGDQKQFDFHDFHFG